MPNWKVTPGMATSRSPAPVSPGFTEGVEVFSIVSRNHRLGPRGTRTICGVSPAGMSRTTEPRCVVMRSVSTRGRNGPSSSGHTMTAVSGTERPNRPIPAGPRSCRRSWPPTSSWDHRRTPTQVPRRG